MEIYHDITWSKTLAWQVYHDVTWSKTLAWSDITDIIDPEHQGPR